MQAQTRPTLVQRVAIRYAKLSPRQRGWERRRELDDFAKNNIPPEYQHAWDKLKSRFKGTPDQRAEQFMEYMEEHPEENDQMLQERADRDLAKMQREQQKQVRLEENCNKNQNRYEEAWYKEQERATKEKRRLKQLQEKAEAACEICPTCDDIPKRDDYDPVPFAASASLRVVSRYKLRERPN